MARYSPDDLRLALGSGLLSFPVTHTTADYAFDEAAYREHLQFLNGYDVAGLFAAGGTGEFFSLTHEEVSTVLKATVEEVKDGTPVMGAAGYGTSTAMAMARQAEADGADGILLLPPYLTELPRQGLYEHVARVCASTSLGVIVYHRANARYDAETVIRLAEEFPNFIGFKDGVVRHRPAGHALRQPRRPADLHRWPAHRRDLRPALPRARRHDVLARRSSTSPRSGPSTSTPSVRGHDRLDVLDRLRDFVVPYIAIRDRQAGYGVSIVKAGLTAAGHPAGPVRPPLTDLTSAELAELTDLVKKVI